ncbi:precorrin-2 dehydrogenase/sirohydrochlorin ferrochelatase family protein [Halobellus rufus]|uniref:precorrin-2 dehydrogenase/sirohydrochlorin ferrochelatase family protein n=1 Tax=Halobellus rufus TaxID=1448860 RepID=UPI000678FE37|nr:bifunctional precorrin-2 dehydrogenase/sirohydrochlorin ferrochelatase [Halobellus rufus]
MIPLYHDFTDRTVLIFGGGPVGARKARRFAAEARVVVVSPDFGERDFGGERSDADVELVRARPRPEDVAAWLDRTDPALVVAATDDGDVNEAVAVAGRDRGVLVNRADRSAASGGSDEGESTDGDGAADDGRSTDSDDRSDDRAADVVVPATVADGDVRVAISTGGRSPALAKYLRERIESEIEGAEEMAALTAELRAELRDAEVDPSARRDAIRAVVRDPLVWKTLRTGASNPRREATRVIRNTIGGDRWTRE